MMVGFYNTPGPSGRDEVVTAEATTAGRHHCQSHIPQLDGENDGTTSDDNLEEGEASPIKVEPAEAAAMTTVEPDAALSAGPTVNASQIVDAGIGTEAGATADKEEGEVSDEDVDEAMSMIRGAMSSQAVGQSPSLAPRQSPKGRHPREPLLCLPACMRARLAHNPKPTTRK